MPTGRKSWLGHPLRRVLNGPDAAARMELEVCSLRSDPAASVNWQSVVTVKAYGASTSGCRTSSATLGWSLVRLQF